MDSVASMETDVVDGSLHLAFHYSTSSGTLSRDQRVGDRHCDYGSIAMVAFECEHDWNDWSAADS